MNTYGPLFDQLLPVPVLAEPRLLASSPKEIAKKERGEARESTVKIREGGTESLDSSGGQNISGQQLKDKGIKQVSEHNENWMERALQSGSVYVFNQTVVKFTGEDLRLWCQARIGSPNHPNAWGALINTLIRRKIIVPTGEHRKMRDSRSHARSTPVYKAK